MAFDSVPDDGRRTARLVLIGEAPGRDEMRLGRPFIGAAGKLLERVWRDVGLRRADFYITNVVPYRPHPSGKIEQVPRDELSAWVDELHDRLAALDDPWVIVPTGNTALRALMDRTDVRITQWRGSIVSYTDRRGRAIKVIPTIHPAACFREPFYERALRADWGRIAGDVQFRELRLPERELHIRPTLDDVEAFAESVRADDVLAFDLETPRAVEWVPTVLKSGKPGKPKREYGARYVACVGLSVSPEYALCVPTTPEYWGSKRACAAAWSVLERVLTSPVEKCYQSTGVFDLWWLARARGLRVRNARWNLHGMHHCMDPADAHDLAWMASCDTREPYWKDQGKDGDDDGTQEFVADINAWWTYNARDAAVTQELCGVYRERLVQRGALALYIRDYRNAYYDLLDLSLHGIGVDAAARAELEQQYATEAAELRAAITEHAGVELYGAKALSPKKLATYLYETLRLPRQHSKHAKGGVTTGEVAIRKLMRTHAQQIGVVGEMILRQRRTAKLREFVAESRVDSEGRFRPTYGFAPETGRMSSSKAPDGTAGNGQNVDRAVRRVYVADEGCCLVQADYSQGESRIVYALIHAVTGNDEVLWRARALPGEYDEHKELAARLFKVAVDGVTGEQRDVGKRTNHAVNYDMHGLTHSEQMSKAGYTFTPEECEQFIQMARQMKPGLEAWHRAVRIEIMRKRALSNAFGNTIRFQYERMDDALYRRGYAYKPQSGLARLMNLHGFGPLMRACRSGEWQGRARVNVHVHDGLVVSVRPEWAYELCEWMRERMEVEVEYEGVPLVVPVTFKVGARWGEGHEFKRLPRREEFEERLR